MSDHGACVYLIVHRTGKVMSKQVCWLTKALGQTLVPTGLHSVQLLVRESEGHSEKMEAVGVQYPSN